ncbi:hypothetical protein LPJ78_004049 [Coemansia sp. RSA 989]|nr:hypothetical protein LPJ78_004049 [Coemansia sp. RSA 989]KAJ1871301.1 hypothetical protein LPJ55_003997 [Coemansia sp. RSA 990]KAJ2669061.1 hypothetical protein IWW42_004825 [Coemansia sp. RSA 1085]
MPFDDEEPRAGDSTAPAAGSGWGADTDAPADKFRRERDSPGRRDRFGREARGRSRSPGDMRMGRHRSRSPKRRPSITDDGDRYIPHYEREREREGGGRYEHRGYGGRGHRMHGRGSPYSRDGGRASAMPDPRTYEQVVPFKYFAEWVKTQDGGRRLEQEEIRDRYEAYRREKLQQLYTQFFNAHKEDDWFAERFEPERRKAYTKLLAERKAENLREFMADLQAGAFDRLTHTATTEQVMLHEVNRRDQSGANRLGSDDDDEDSAITHTLFIRTVPPSVPRAVLEEKLKDLPGYRYLALSEPRQDKQYQRFGWVRFEDGTDMEKTLESLGDINIDQFQFHFSRHTNSSVVGMRLTPDVVSSEERIRLDLKLVREAVRSLDARTDAETFHSLATLQDKARELSAAAGELAAGDEAGGSAAMDGDAPADHGEDTAMGDADADAGRPADGADGEPRLPLDAARRELDLLLEYLRRVHYYCYYCGHTADNAEDFARRCAKLHLRRALPAHRSPQPCGNWLRNMDNRNDVIIHPLEGERLLKEGGKSMERETDNILNEHINQLDEGRFRCLLCTKLFKGDAFVRKHIRNKHPEAVPETLVHEISFFNNFVREATHYIQLGTGGALATMAGAPGGGMRDRNAGFMPQMFPGMMIPGMVPAPYMVPGMVPGMMPGMMQMGGQFVGPNMMGMVGSERSQSMYGPPRHANNGRGDPRAVRSYVDLDAPAEGEADFGF